MNAHIVTIGSELLIGDITNTNAGAIGSRLIRHGFSCDRALTISDDREYIRRAMEEGLREADITIVTGGLGPTKDDITKAVLYEFFPSEPKLDEATLEHIKDTLGRRNIPITESNTDQAWVPADCEVMFNKRGTAPGIWAEYGGRFLAVLPGVPSEMEYLMDNEVMPRLNHHFPSRTRYFSRYFKMAGIGESTLSDLNLADIEHYTNGAEISVASLPSEGVLTLRVSACADSEQEADQKLAPCLNYIEQAAGEFIFGRDNQATIAGTAGELLLAEQKTLAVAESCTGGKMCDLITQVPGCSGWYYGGINCYANHVKTGLLGVSEQTLIDYGAVSKQTALELAESVAQKTGADIGVATTGVAGPSGGTPEKPVGTIWVGYYDRQQHFALKLQLFKSRYENKVRGAVIALDIVRRVLSGITVMPYGLEPESAESR